MEHAAQQIALQEYLHAVTEATTRIGRLEQAMRDTLLGLRPDARVVGVPSHNLGPVHTLAEGLHALDQRQFEHR